MNEQILDDNFSEKDTSYLDNLTRFERLGSMFLDHFFLCFTFIPFLIFLDITFLRDTGYSEFTFISLFVIYLNKDILNGRSFAKRYLGQIIIDNESEAPASELKCLIRNLTIPFWIIEVIFVIISPSRRIGDLMAGTRVVRVEKVTFKHSLSEFKNAKKWNWVLVFILAFFYIYFIFDKILFSIY